MVPRPEPLWGISLAREELRQPLLVPVAELRAGPDALQRLLDLLAAVRSGMVLEELLHLRGVRLARDAARAGGDEVADQARLPVPFVERRPVLLEELPAHGLHLDR